MVTQLAVSTPGYHSCTQENGAFAFCRMDSGLEVLPAGSTKTWEDPVKETALLLFGGQVTLRTESNRYEAKRGSLFTEGPHCLHIARGRRVEVTAAADSELLVLQTTNERDFPEVFYTPDSVEDRILGGEVWNDTAKRVIRDIFTYDNAPYSNLVVGEIINLPGRWSSYTPHWHRQPELYYYRFDRPQGFGACFVGDETYRITHDSFATLPGGLCHPQVTAPGYAMYYTWVIRHLENDPWNERIVDPVHDWLNGENPAILNFD